MRHREIILASTSPRRLELLRKTGLKFTVVPSDYEEDMSLPLAPGVLCKKLALGKAMAVAQKRKNGLIISADTFVILGEKILGKPKSIVEAKKMLRLISGKKVKIITAFAVVDVETKKKVVRVARSAVWIKSLNAREIEAYVKTGEPMDKAGAFAVQGLGAVLIARVEGDFMSVMGLSLYELNKVLKEFGVHIL